MVASASGAVAAIGTDGPRWCQPSTVAREGLSSTSTRLIRDVVVVYAVGSPVSFSISCCGGTTGVTHARRVSVVDHVVVSYKRAVTGCLGSTPCTSRCRRSTRPLAGFFAMVAPFGVGTGILSVGPSTDLRFILAPDSTRQAHGVR